MGLGLGACAVWLCLRGRPSTQMTCTNSRSSTYNLHVLHVVSRSSLISLEVSRLFYGRSVASSQYDTYIVSLKRLADPLKPTYRAGTWNMVDRMYSQFTGYCRSFGCTVCL